MGIGITLRGPADADGRAADEGRGEDGRAVDEKPGEEGRANDEGRGEDGRAADEGRRVSLVLVIALLWLLSMLPADGDSMPLCCQDAIGSFFLSSGPTWCPSTIKVLSFGIRTSQKRILESSLDPV